MIGFSGQLQDKIESLKNELNILNRRYEAAMKISDHALWEYDVASKTMHLSKKLYGRYSEINKDIPDYRIKMLEWKLVHPEDLNIFNQYCDSLDSGDRKFSYEYRQITDNNLFRWLRSEGTTVFDNVGNPKKVIGRTIDITVEKESDEILIERAHTDFLTKINSKENTYNLIKRTIEETPNVKSGFLLIDVDDFKYINDSFGHSFGDKVLVQAATILTVNKNNSKDIIGRLGGDEFCVFLYDIDSSDDVLEYYSRVRDSIADITFGDSHLKFSVGAVVFPDMAGDLTEILTKADLALYQTKFNNKDSITFFDSSMTMPDMNKVSGHSRDIDSLSAIEHIEINKDNYFDPVKVKDDLINSYEAFRDLNIAYYIITEDYKIKYCSPNLKEVFSGCEKVILGTNCYETIRKQKAPCADCPLRNGVNSNIHFTNSSDYSEMDYNVTYHRFNNNSNILVCWNDLTDFSKASAFMNDYLTKMMIYSNFVIESNKLIKQNDKSFKIAFISIDDFRNLSKNNDLNKAIDLFVTFASYLKTFIRDNELVTTTSPHEFFAFLEDDGAVEERLNQFVLDSERMLKERLGDDVKINIGIEAVSSDDNNTHVIALKAKSKVEVKTNVR